MSKPIKLNEELIQKYAEEFEAALRGEKFPNGKITFSKTVEYDKGEVPPATVVFEPKAYAKMLSLLHAFDSEVAWHGVVTRDEDVFYIHDILVYPQEVSGATVNTDQEGYQRWMMELPDEVANHLHLQGHSHVNMGTSSSGVDETHQQSILKMIPNDGFYIFMIYNKRLEHNIKIYDMANNVLYEDKDIEVMLDCEGCDLDAFVKNAKEVVTTKTYQSYYQTNYAAPPLMRVVPDGDEPKKENKKKAKGKKEGKSSESKSKPSWQESIYAGRKVPQDDSEVEGYYDDFWYMR